MTHYPCALPPSLLEHHQQVTLCVDIFYVRGLPFFHSISTKIHFRTATQLANRSKPLLLDQFQQIVQLYHARGFNVSIVRGGGEFQCLKNDILPITLDAVSADDHVDVVERSIRTVKGDCRTLTHGLPFKRIPRLLVTEIVLFSIKSRNMFPPKDGISSSLSPLSIVTGARKVDVSH